MHPGWADTPGLASSLPAFHRLMRPLLRTPARRQSTRSCGWPRPRRGCAPSGKLYLDRGVRPFDRVPGTRLTAADRRALWDAVVIALRRIRSGPRLTWTGITSRRR